MPKPTVLPVLDWREIFASGRSFADWIQEGESPDNREAMQVMIDEQVLEPQQESLLAKMSRPIHVVAIAEDWCGDVVQFVPVLERFGRATEHLHVRYLPREQRPEVFVRFLTNGGEAIPRFIFLSDQFVECGNWGPMPEICRDTIARGKACGDIPAARRLVSGIYAADPAKQMAVRELLELIQIAAAEAP